MKVDFRRLTSSVAATVLSLALLLVCVLTSDAAVDDVTSLEKDVTYLENVAVPCCVDKSLGDDDVGALTVVIVCSAVENQPRRDVIRSTWGSYASSGLRVVFLLGQSAGNTAADVSVASESARHGDVIQVAMDDTYERLTYKSLAALRWSRDHCACARFVVKADDDIFLNTRLLVRDLSTCAHQRFIMGHIIARAAPVRQPDEKLYTPKSLFRGPAYPTYASGAAYVISGDAVEPLLEAAASGAVPLFWIEDVYISGMLARAAGVQLIVNGKLDGYRTLVDDCSIGNHLALHRVSPVDMQRLWQAVTQTNTLCREQTKLL